MQYDSALLLSPGDVIRCRRMGEAHIIAGIRINPFCRHVFVRCRDGREFDNSEIKFGRMAGDLSVR